MNLNQKAEIYTNPNDYCDRELELGIKCEKTTPPRYETTNDDERQPVLKTFGNIANFLFTENSKLGQGISVKKTKEQETTSFNIS